jgi:zinc protease
MKRISAFILFLLIGVFAIASPSKIESLKLKNGIDLYLRKNSTSKVLCVNIVIKVGTEFLSDEENGLEEVVLSMLTRGSKKYSLENIQGLLYSTQGTLSVTSIENGSVFSLSCIDYYFDDLFDVYMDSFLNPLFEEKEFNLMVKSYQNSIDVKLKDPSSYLFTKVSEELYKNHPYLKSSSPDALTVSSLPQKFEVLKKLYKKLLDTNRLSVVACGNFNEEDLLKKLNDTLGNLPAAKEKISSSKIQPLLVKGENAVYTHDNAGFSSYVMKVFESPSYTSKDYIASKLAAKIYSEILYSVVREKYGACYTPQSFTISSKAPYGGIYFYSVSNLDVIKDAECEAENIMASGKIISGKDKDGNFIFESLKTHLENYINSYLNSSYEGTLTNASVCARMSGSLLMYGDVNYSSRMIKSASKVRVKDIERVFKKYFMSENNRWFVVCGPDLLESACGIFK